MAGLALARAGTAQQPDTLSESRRVDGRVLRGTNQGPRPAAGVRVVLHRVGSDRAGPLDSALTTAQGRYTFRYNAFGSPDAIYFVSASYDGIAYFSAPLRQREESGDNASITVFDTTAVPFEIHLAGRHFVLGAPDPKGRREVVEVYDLQNDSSVTLVSRGDSGAVFTTHLPELATNPTVNPSGDIAPAAVRFAGDSVVLFAPLSPGIRQLSFSYLLPHSAMPLSIPLARSVGVLELLAEEPRARITGARLAEVAPVSTGGRSFRRFLAQDVPAGSVISVDVPFSVEDARTRVLWAVAALFGAAMITSMAVALRRRARPRAAVPAPAAPLPPAEAAVESESPARALVRELALLDTRFQGIQNPSDEQRARYAADRAALKARLVAMLAAERRPA